jgi:hypothetical protein
MANVICPYCQQPARLVDGEDLYPHRPDLYGKLFYSCAPCKAHVGTHPGTDRPLGRLANAELRRAKSAAHAAFDPLWKSKNATMSRKGAYTWLSQKMGLAPEQTHVGMFDVAQCIRVVELCRAEPITPAAPKVHEAPKHRKGKEFRPSITPRTDFSLQVRGDHVEPWD